MHTAFWLMLALGCVYLVSAGYRAVAIRQREARAAKAQGGLRIRAWDAVHGLGVVTRWQAEHWAKYGRWAPLGPTRESFELAAIDIERFKLQQKHDPNARTVWP